jgi:hypothetical protein
MDAPPPHEDPRPFVAVAEWLSSRGFSAPEILARDLDKGLLLLGDFGTARLRETADSDPQRERELYELATDVLVQLHQHPPMPGLPCTGWSNGWKSSGFSPTGTARRSASRSTSRAYRSAWTQVLGPSPPKGWAR